VSFPGPESDIHTTLPRTEVWTPEGENHTVWQSQADNPVNNLPGARMNRVRNVLLVSLTLLFSAACASSGVQRSSGSPDKLERAEIDASNATSVYDVINHLRPNWLRPAGMTMTGVQNSGTQQVTVYLDNQPLGAIETLRSMTTASVGSIEFLSATRAATVLPAMPNGIATAVILVKSR
jgi:hypothetical protein